MSGSNMSKEPWSEELMRRVSAALRPGDVVHTLGVKKPNWIIEIGSDGVLVHTERSRDAGKPQVVEGWMVQVAWDHLLRHGQLTNKQLLNDLKVKRSSAVCAILSELPEVQVFATNPITLVKVDASPGS
jgi:hypothetical protein